jgi:hypothetical protein
MSDHGEMLGDHGIYWKGPYFYGPAIHVPLDMFQRLCDRMAWTVDPLPLHEADW